MVLKVVAGHILQIPRYLGMRRLKAYLGSLNLILSSAFAILELLEFPVSPCLHLLGNRYKATIPRCTLG